MDIIWCGGTIVGRCIVCLVEVVGFEIILYCGGSFWGFLIVLILLSCTMVESFLVGSIIFDVMSNKVENGEVVVLIGVGFGTIFIEELVLEY